MEPPDATTFAAQYPAHTRPCQRLPKALAGKQPRLGDQCGSLFLHCKRLSLSTSRRPVCRDASVFATGLFPFQMTSLALHQTKRRILSRTCMRSGIMKWARKTNSRSNESPIQHTTATFKIGAGSSSSRKKMLSKTAAPRGIRMITELVLHQAQRRPAFTLNEATRSSQRIAIRGCHSFGTNDFASKS